MLDEIYQNDGDNRSKESFEKNIKTVSKFSRENIQTFWTEILKSPRNILAPMVDQSELAFRLLVRQFDVHCTYSPMFNSGIFVKDVKYQQSCLKVVPELDRPLIIQFCANDPEIFLKAAKIAEPYCDAIDLNLGCPQTIARRGHYGAFLQDEWKLIHDIVNLAARNLSKPITCKIRIFNDVKRSIEYAQMIEKAGASMICVHGRIREQKGPLTGLADWSQIKAIKDNVGIPVIANGNIQSSIEADECLEVTGVDGIMSAEGLLYNPALFTNEPLPVWEATEKYIELARKYPCPFPYIRGHVFKFFHHCLMLNEHEKLRDIVAKTHSDEDFLLVANDLRKFYWKEYQDFIQKGVFPAHPKMLPVYFCRPYYRPAPNQFNSPINCNVPNQIVVKENCDKIIESTKSICKIKIKQKIKKKESNRRNPLPLCSQCKNPKGLRCDYDLCRICCRRKILNERSICVGHRFKNKMH
ncbi:tRNA-dihydrouridine(16/17) synthase [NAD(P)(+)]-like [Sarcoptes scabiei]|uniref:tRNA-dihydrouridine(16/17) synthase [NAD(P)(+)] n=1 Tax=Sarcoptes scabiei TaxID=52283 RepID=A0A834VAC0_SARSC|nr:tRNA-dihydrouridine(16/17) synthase [NAD(P)(+)]-like [Sarcoptes scabiei]